MSELNKPTPKQLKSKLALQYKFKKHSNAVNPDTTDMLTLLMLNMLDTSFIEASGALESGISYEQLRVYYPSAIVDVPDKLALQLKGFLTKLGFKEYSESAATIDLGAVCGDDYDKGYLWYSVNNIGDRIPINFTGIKHISEVSNFITKYLTK
jgi:hypothetical protein